MYGASMEQVKPWIENFDHRLNSMINEITARFPGGCNFFWRIFMIQPMG